MPPPMPPPMPMAYGPLPPTPRLAARRTATVLWVAVVALMATAGVFVALYIAASGDRDTAAGTLDDRRTELARVTDRGAEVEQARVDTSARIAELESTRTELSECVDAVRHFLWANLTPAEQNTALDQMFALCK
ncbi:hypothetical protein [Actinophytocola sediminis]